MPKIMSLSSPIKSKDVQSVKNEVEKFAIEILKLPPVCKQLESKPSHKFFFYLIYNQPASRKA